jgi:hypothetical protein
MNTRKFQHHAVGRSFWTTLAAWLIQLSAALGGAEEKFDVLQIGTQTYSNVTVTTKAKNYIFILHATGMTSIKTADLPVELRQQLGYDVPAAPKGTTNNAANWAKREIAKISGPQLRVLGKQLDQKWRGSSPAGLTAISLISPTLVFIVLVIALLFYLFHCYCCMLICQKTGNPPGVWVWVPVLQLFPLLRAAGMSGWWFLGYCLPVVNIVAQVLWCFKIAKARGKSVWVGVLLLLPISSLFAFLYLAFSNAASAKANEEAEPKVMTLQAA